MKFKFDEKLRPLEVDLKSINEDEILLNMLDLNAEQLTYYLENVILENPFIELERGMETQVIVDDSYQDKHISKRGSINEVDDSLPRLPQSLPIYLYEQIQLYRRTEIRDIMMELVELLDERGYLPYTYQEIAEKFKVDEMVALDALTLFKQLEPAGVGAYDLQEALMLQTEQDHKAPNVAYYLLETQFSNIMAKDYKKIQEETNLSQEEIKEAVNYYNTLRTRPASVFEKGASTSFFPDLNMRLYPNGVIELTYNSEAYPKVLFNEAYYNEMKALDDPEVNDFIKNHQKEYDELVENIKLRRRMLLYLTALIIQVQKDFFLDPENTQKHPLSFKDLSQLSGLNESVVRLLISNKNLEFKQYVLPLTDFINVAAVEGRSGLSAINIKDMVIALVEKDESITDSRISEILAEENIMISEQVIRLYRESYEG